MVDLNEEKIALAICHRLNSGHPLFIGERRTGAESTPAHQLTLTNVSVFCLYTLFWVDENEELATSLRICFSKK